MRAEGNLRRVAIDNLVADNTRLREQVAQLTRERDELKTNCIGVIQQELDKALKALNKDYDLIQELTLARNEALARAEQAALEMRDMNRIRQEADERAERAEGERDEAMARAGCYLVRAERAEGERETLRAALRIAAQYVPAVTFGSDAPNPDWVQIREQLEEK